MPNQLAAATPEDLKVLHRLSNIPERLFIGITAALVTYFLIQAGLLQQTVSEGLVPKLPLADSAIDRVYPLVNQLIIWSFPAVFPEILVSGILQKIETRMSEQPQG